MSTSTIRLASLLTLSLGVSFLVGCGGSFESATEAVTTSGTAIQGQVMGGQQPIVGAKIYLMQANPIVWKGASTSLLKSASNTTNAGSPTDTTSPLYGAYYVTTSSPGGTFNISGDYSCTAGTQVYLLGVGGNSLGTSTSVSNSAIAQMALLGSCPSSGSFAASVPFIVLNELSTVAAAYSLAGFAKDYLHIGGWATTAQTTGLANAFLSAGNLVSLGGGNAYASTPAGNGTVPQSKLNTLADIIATCVNTTSNTSSACSTLFTATPNAAGTKPTTTFDAILNLAQNPTINSTNSGLINQPTAVSPFLPYLSANPNDWTVSVKYTAPNASGPARPDVDTSGNVWIPNLTGNSLIELSTRGVVLSGTAGFTGGGLNQPESIAIDRAAGAVWVSNYGSGRLSRFSMSGTADSASPYTTGNASGFSVLLDRGKPLAAGSNGIYQLASNGTGGYTSSSVTTTTTYNSNLVLSPTGDLWAIQYEGNTLSQLAGSAYTLTTYSGGGLTNPAGLDSDFSGNLWVANAGSSAASEFNYSGVANAASPFSGAGLLKAYDVHVDGYNRPFFSNANGSLSALTTAGAAVSGSNGYITDSTASYNANPNANIGGFPAHAITGFVIDQAGNLWAPDLDNNIYEFVGLTTPSVPVVQKLQIACGATASYTSGAGQTWVPDTNYVTGPSAAAGYSNAITNAYNNQNPAPAGAYLAERYNNFSTTPFVETIPNLTPGASYNVNLHFVENYWNAAGSRVFNVTINGTQVLTNFDIFAQAGGQNIAITRNFTTTADSNGKIAVSFTTVTDNSKCTGIEIVQN